MEQAGWSGWSDEEPTQSLPAPPSPPPHGRRRKRILWTASAILALIGVLSVLIATAPLVVGASSLQLFAPFKGTTPRPLAATPFPTATEIPLVPLANSPQG